LFNIHVLEYLDYDFIYSQCVNLFVSSILIFEVISIVVL